MFSFAFFESSDSDSGDEIIERSVRRNLRNVSNPLALNDTAYVFYTKYKKKIVYIVYNIVNYSFKFFIVLCNNFLIFNSNLYFKHAKCNINTYIYMFKTNLCTKF